MTAPRSSSLWRKHDAEVQVRDAGDPRLDVIYEVEADNLEEAKAKALRGDTVSETDIKCRGVNDRDIWEELV